MSRDAMSSPGQTEVSREGRRYPFDASKASQQPPMTDEARRLGLGNARNVLRRYNPGYDFGELEGNDGVDHPAPRKVVRPFPAPQDQVREKAMSLGDCIAHLKGHDAPDSP